MVDDDPDLDVDHAFLGRWFAVARQLAELTNHRDAREAVAFQDAYRRKVGPSLIGRGGWPYHLRRPLTSNLVDAYRRPASEHKQGVFRRGVGAKCLIWAWSLVRDRPDEIPSHERAVIMARHDLDPYGTGPDLGAVLHARRTVMMERDRFHARSAHDATSPEVALAEVAFPWRRHGAPLHHGSVGHAPILLPVVDPASAPVAVRLARPDGGMLDVRHADGIWSRPVLAPGTWEPVRLEAFRAAVREGVAWADHPFARTRRGGSVAFDLHDMVAPDPGPAPLEVRRRDATGRVLTDGHRLSVVDGVVHVGTTRPVLGLMYDGEHRATAAWCMREDGGGLVRETTSVDDMSTCPSGYANTRHWIPGFSLVHDGRCEFPVTCAREMASVFGRWAAALDAEGLSSVWVREEADGVTAISESLVEILDRAPFPRSPAEGMLGMACGVAASLAERLRATFPGGLDVRPGMPRYGAVHVAFREALGLLVSGDGDACLGVLDDAVGEFGRFRTNAAAGDVFLWSVLAEAKAAIEAAPTDDADLAAFVP